MNKTLKHEAEVATIVVSCCKGMKNEKNGKRKRSDTMISAIIRTKYCAYYCVMFCTMGRMCAAIAL